MSGSKSWLVGDWTIWVGNSDARLAALLIGYAVVGKLLDLPRFAFVLTRLFPLADGRGVFPAVVVLLVEFLLALCLLAQPADRWVRRYAATMFFAFAIVHFANLTANSQIMECGCFGVLQGNMVTSLFDTPLKALLLNSFLGLLLLRMDLHALAIRVRLIAVPSQ